MLKLVGMEQFALARTALGLPEADIDSIKEKSGWFTFKRVILYTHCPNKVARERLNNFQRAEKEGEWLAMSVGRGVKDDKWFIK